MKHKLCAFLLFICLLAGCTSPVGNPTTAPTVDPTVDMTLTPSPSGQAEDSSDWPSIIDTSTPSICQSTGTPSGAPTAKLTAGPTDKTTPKPTATAKPTAKPTPSPTPRTYDSDATLDDMDSRDYDGRYVGSRESDKYHHPTCRHAQRILIRNAIWWNSTSEAQSAGYSPCGTCQP